MAVERKISVEEYLELEKHSEVRHEYVDGELIAMAGDKRRNNRIALNFVRVLAEVADAKGCETAAEGIKIRTRKTRYRYPDFVVSCDPGDDEYFIENPCFIVEVLSPTTSDTDTTIKLEEYTNLPTLNRYVLVEPERALVIVYKREGQRWILEILEGGGEVEVPCLDDRVTLEQIYQGVNFRESK